MLHQVIALVIALVAAWLLANGYHADQASYDYAFNSPVPGPAPTAAPICWGTDFCQHQEIR